jgi:hypothetical protein
MALVIHHQHYPVAAPQRKAGARSGPFKCLSFRCEQQWISINAQIKMRTEGAASGWRRSARALSNKELISEWYGAGYMVPEMHDERTGCHNFWIKHPIVNLRRCLACVLSPESSDSSRVEK